MDAWMLWSLIVAGLGVLFVGIYIGERNKVIEDRSNNRIRMINGADTTWFYAGLVAIIFSGVLALIGANPPEKLIEHADQIRLETTAEENFEH